MVNTYHGTIFYRSDFENGSATGTYILNFVQRPRGIEKDSLQAATLPGLALNILNYSPKSTWEIENYKGPELIDLETSTRRNRLTRPLSLDELLSFSMSLSLKKSA